MAFCAATSSTSGTSANPSSCERSRTRRSSEASTARDALAALGLGGLAGTGTEHEPGATHHDGHERQQAAGDGPGQGEACARTQQEQTGDGEEHDAGLDARLLGGERRQQHRPVDRAARGGEVATTRVELGELAAQLGEQHDLAGGALGLDAHVARGERLGRLAERRAPGGDRGLGRDDLGLLVVDRLGRALAGRGLLVERGAGGLEVVAGSHRGTDAGQLGGIGDADDVELEVEPALEVGELLAAALELLLLLCPRAEPVLERGHVGVQAGELGAVAGLELAEGRLGLGERRLATAHLFVGGLDRGLARRERGGGVGGERSRVGTEQVEERGGFTGLDERGPQLAEASGPGGLGERGALAGGQVVDVGTRVDEVLAPVGELGRGALGVAQLLVDGPQLLAQRRHLGALGAGLVQLLGAGAELVAGLRGDAPGARDAGRQQVVLQVAVGERGEVVQLVEAHREDAVVDLPVEAAEEGSQLGVGAGGAVGAEERDHATARVALLDAGDGELLVVVAEEEPPRAEAARRG